MWCPKNLTPTSSPGSGTLCLHRRQHCVARKNDSKNRRNLVSNISPDRLPLEPVLSSQLVGEVRQPQEPVWYQETVRLQKMPGGTFGITIPRCPMNCKQCPSKTSEYWNRRHHARCNGNVFQVIVAVVPGAGSEPVVCICMFTVVSQTWFVDVCYRFDLY